MGMMASPMTPDAKNPYAEPQKFIRKPKGSTAETAKMGIAGGDFGRQQGSGGRDGTGRAPETVDPYELMVNPAWDKWFNDNMSRKPKTKARDTGTAGGTGRPSNRKRAGSGTILTDPLGAGTVLGS